MTVKAKHLLSQSNRIISLTFLCFIVGLAQSLHANECEEPVAQAISVQGQVEVLHSNEPAWIPLSLNDRLCPGDRLRVKAASRAGLLLHNDTLLRLDELTNVTVNAPAEDGSFWIDLLKGVTHFISRVKGSFQVKTPYVNASIEGTEFVVKVSDREADVVVFEGVVVASNRFGSVELTTNQAARATRRNGPILAAMANPRDAVVWTLYYPPLPEQPDEAYDLAQQAVTAIVQNRLEDAIGLAKQALAANDQSAAAYMAQSYVDQAQFDIPAALANSRKAAELAPDSALTQARLAEVWLMNGETREARRAAREAVALDPQLSLAHAALGFSSLREVNLDTARNAFEKAIRLDSAAPLPRFGLGLVKIRQGELESGRREIETAVLLDPNSALMRSYLGKAYYEEKRSGLAADQFAMAKTLDPNDPTPWFYDSILLQSENRPVEALRAQQQAIKLNDNRAVYRSRQLLDEDQAARSTSQARIYDDLGFERLALKESWKSLATDPGNSSAHRFLSDSYANVPRHEIARVSELLQAQMLTPEIVAPVSPSASEVDLLKLQGSGPSLAGYNEYNPLFNRKRLAFQASGFTGSKNTRGEEIAVGGFTDRGMLSTGYYKESSDGFRENSDSEQSVRNVFGQYRVNSDLSIQGEIKHRAHKYGYLEQLYEQDFILAQITRNETEADSYRLGLNYRPNLNHTFLLSAIKHDENSKATVSVIDRDAAQGEKQFEVRYIFNDAAYGITAGLGQVDTDEVSVLTRSFPGAPPPQESTRLIDQKTAYLYLDNSWFWGRSLIGFDYTNLDIIDLSSETQFSPKLGLIWNLSKKSVLRLAGFKTIRTEITNNWTIAPTEIIGFNQIYDDLRGTEAMRYALALDHQFSDNLDTGIEFSRRVISRLFDDLTDLDKEQRELSHKGFLYWSINSNVSFGTIYSFEKDQRDFIDGQYDPRRPATLHTQTLALKGNYFHQSGFFSELSTSYVSQEVESILPTTGTARKEDNFVITDATLGFRLPRQLGLIEFEIKNMFDREFLYQSTFTRAGTPISPPYNPERSYYLKVNIWL